MPFCANCNSDEHNKLLTIASYDAAYVLDLIDSITCLCNFLLTSVALCLQCFDTVGWTAGRASGLWKTKWWGAGVVVCLERGADLHMVQLMPLPLTVSCFSKIQIGFIFLVPAHPGSPGQRAMKWVCVCVAFCTEVCAAKIAPYHGGCGPHLIHGFLGPSESTQYPKQHLDCFSHFVGLMVVTSWCTHSHTHIHTHARTRKQRDTHT